jgi:hypothetical protein
VLRSCLEFKTLKMSRPITPKQRDWIAEEVTKGHELSEYVYSRIQVDDVPDFPSQEAVIDSVQAALTGELAAFMRRGDKPRFSCVTKLLVPGFRQDLLMALVNAQTGLARLDVDEELMAQLQEAPSRVEQPTWYWDFGQGSRLLLRPQKNDDASLPLLERVATFKASMPDGMRGTDLSAWATRAAIGLSIQTPFDTTGSDILFEGRCSRSHITLIDENGTVNYKGRRSIPASAFRVSPIGLHLGACPADETFSERVRLRASIDGPVMV